MTFDVTPRDPWIQTVGLLGHLCNGGLAEYIAGEVSGKQQTKRPDSAQVSGLRISLVEWSGATIVTLAWRDSTHCSYGDQVWHLTHAHKDGVCVISGRRIRRGEAVFKPRATRPAALNAGAMILTSVLQDSFAG